MPHNQTCSISRLPINLGDKCIMILMDEECDFIFNRLRRDVNFGYKTEKLLIMKKFFHVIKEGIYNDEGYINEMDIQDSSHEEFFELNYDMKDSIKAIFFRKDMYDLILNNIGNIDEYNIDILKSGCENKKFYFEDEDLKKFYVVMYFLIQNRIYTDTKLFQESTFCGIKILKEIAEKTLSIIEEDKLEEQEYMRSFWHDE